MRVIVLTNPSAGATVDPAERLLQVLRDAGVEAEVREIAGSEITQAAERAAGEAVDAVVAAGGDGTVSACASALAGTAMPL